MSDLLKRLGAGLWRRVANSAPARILAGEQLRGMGVNPWAAQALREFMEGGCGAAYGLGRVEKTRLAGQFARNTREIESGTASIVHTLLAMEILSIPPEVKGDVVECGVWKGASSASLSLVCQAVGRRLKVCDSFQGLPDDALRRHTGMHTGVYGHYKEGMFHGALEEVRENITRHGAVDACDFIEGFFAESLTALDGPVAFAFLDVDLESSTRDCLRHIWPRLVENGAIYSDDAGDLDVVRVYFDEPWWRENLGCAAPGFVGSGCGLPLSATYSSLGYTRKHTQFDPARWRRVPFLHYPDGSGS